VKHPWDLRDLEASLIQTDHRYFSVLCQALDQLIELCIGEASRCRDSHSSAWLRGCDSIE
jgi:hypothetical protein